MIYRCGPVSRKTHCTLQQNQRLPLTTGQLLLNQCFRFYRYESGGFFGFHTDGSWPGSRVIDGKAVTDAFGDRYNLYTLLIFLSDDFEGGETQFLSF